MSQSKVLDVLRWLTLIAALIVTATSSAETRRYTVESPDGVTIAVQESGDPAGRPIIFIHGLLGSHLNWEEQVTSPVLQRYRLITYDLRGHGSSSKPPNADAYTDGRRWADDLAAVIAGSNAQAPVLVGWSLGGTVITNYLAAYGDERIAGALYVGGVIELHPDQITPHPQVYRDLSSADLRTHLDAEREFLRLCFEKQPDPTTFQRLLANAALASFEMQVAVHSMTVDATKGLSTLRKPLLLLYGAHDSLVRPEPSIARAVALNSNIRSTVYADSGHAPFLEEADRFNRDLVNFVEGIEQR